MSNHTTSLLRILWCAFVDGMEAIGAALCSLMEDDVDGGRSPLDGDRR